MPSSPRAPRTAAILDSGATQTVLPIIVNAIHPPAPSPARCYAFGQMLCRAIERSPDAGRVHDELRQTIVMLGALGAAVPEILHYEPFYRAIMGIAVGCWDRIPTLVT